MLRGFESHAFGLISKSCVIAQIQVWGCRFPAGAHRVPNKSLNLSKTDSDPKVF
jgi:hypothetical protein